MENGNTSTGMVPALLSGLLSALVFMPLAGLSGPSPFGLTRWIHGFLIVSLVPSAIPLLLHVLLYGKHREGTAVSRESFILLYAVPIGVVQSISGDSLGGSLPLLIMPVLWTSLAIGVPGILRLAESSRGPAAWASAAAAVLLPFVAATAYWAFFIQEALLGAGLTALCLVPAALVLYRPLRLALADGAEIAADHVETP